MTADAALPQIAALSAPERQDLLWLARESIHATLSGTQARRAIALTPELLAPTAAFVSLHRQGSLRGCIGTVTANTPLHLTVARMAVAAAREDPRFEPLSIAELPEVRIEISRLSPMVRARPEQVQPGLHGVAISWGGCRAVFLPQVAASQQWDRDTLLGELCRKALLPTDTWMHPEVSLQVFVAEVFEEADYP
jgi:AmmeMemoRadiSam system protein A